MYPGTDNETLGTIHAATSSPIAHDARSTNARSRIRLVTISVGRWALAGRRRTTAKTTARRMDRHRHRDRVVAVLLVLMPVRVWFATEFIIVGARGADVTRRCLRST